MLLRLSGIRAKGGSGVLRNFFENKRSNNFAKRERGTGSLEFEARSEKLEAVLLNRSTATLCRA
jgi:hypothetical protein